MGWFISASLWAAILLALPPLSQSAGEHTRATDQSPKQVDPFVSLRADTDEERVRAKFFSGNGTYSLLQRDLVPSLQDEDNVNPPSKQNYATYIRTQVCSSDAVVVGRPLEEEVKIAADEAFLYTNYSVAVDLWIRPTGRFQKNIVVSRAGGQVTVAGKTLKALAGGALKAKHEYVLFLKAIPKTSGYVRHNQPEIELVNGKTHVVPKGRFYPEELKAGVSRANFIIDLVNAQGTCGGAQR